MQVGAGDYRTTALISTQLGLGHHCDPALLNKTRGTSKRYEKS